MGYGEKVPMMAPTGRAVVSSPRPSSGIGTPSTGDGVRVGTNEGILLLDGLGLMDGATVGEDGAIVVSVVGIAGAAEVGGVVVVSETGAADGTPVGATGAIAGGLVGAATGGEVGSVPGHPKSAGG